MSKLEDLYSSVEKRHSFDKIPQKGWYILIEWYDVYDRNNKDLCGSKITD